MSTLDMIPVYVTAALLGAVVAVIILAVVRRPRPPHCKACATGHVHIPAELEPNDPVVAIIRRSSLRPCAKNWRLAEHAERLAAGRLHAARTPQPHGSAPVPENVRIQLDALRDRRRGARR
ncbi:MAG: hypothetical protein ACRDT8_00055 [Micromonosporaceae bacterium]